MKNFKTIICIVLAVSLSLSFVGCSKPDKDGEFSANYVEIEPTRENIDAVVEEINSVLNVTDYGVLSNASQFDNFVFTYEYESVNEETDNTTRYDINMKVNGDAAPGEVFALINIETLISSQNVDHCFRILIIRKSGSTSTTYNDYTVYPLQVSPDVFNGGYIEGWGGNIQGDFGYKSFANAYYGDDLPADTGDFLADSSVLEIINPTDGYNEFYRALFRLINEYHADFINEPISEFTHPFVESGDHTGNIGAFMQELRRLPDFDRKTYKAYKSDNGFYKLVWDEGATYYLKVNDDGTYHFKSVGGSFTQELKPFDEKIADPRDKH